MKKGLVQIPAKLNCIQRRAAVSSAGCCRQRRRIAIQMLAALTAVTTCAAIGNPLPGSGDLDELSYQTWQTENGLPQNTVHSILQTSDGYIWLATEGGLVRFDGFKFVVFDSRNTAALRTNNVRSLAEGSERELWIGTAQGLCRLKDGRFQAFTTAEGLPGNNILSLYKDHSGKVWMVTPEGVARLDVTQGRGSFETVRVNESSPKLTGAVAIADDGTIWLGTQVGLDVIVARKLHSLSTRALASGGVEALLLDRHKRLWAGTTKGLFVTTLPISEKSNWQPYHAGNHSEAAGILSIFEDRNGEIWLATENGVAQVTDEAAGLYRYGRSLYGTEILALNSDREGDIWIGTEAEGVTVARAQKFATYTARDGLADDVVRCVFEDANGVVWVGTTTGLTSIDHGIFKSSTTASGLSSNVILSLGEDKNGNLLVGTPDGLNKMTNHGVTLITSADGLPDDFVRSLYKDADGSLWVGTRHGLSHMEDNSFKTYTQAEGLGSDLVGAVVRDRDHNLWVGTFDGLTRMSGGKLTTYRTKDGLSSNVITALHEDGEGTLWIGTQDGGLNVLRNERFHSFPRKLGLPEAVYGLLEDGGDNLWLASNAGIVRASRSELRQVSEGKRSQATVVWYGTSDGLRISECSAGGHPEVWRGKNGSLWFSTLKGVAVLNHDMAKLNRVPPPVVIEAVEMDDHTVAPKQIRDVKPGYRRFAFEYAGLSFAAPQKVQYRYRLQGFDKSWIEAGTRRAAYYTNIPPGRYSFQVLARNNDGYWNEQGASLAFRLEPHYYQTYWFYSLIGMALCLAGYLIYRWRLAEAEARFAAVLQERNRIAREIHDTLAQGFVGVSVQLEIVSRLLSSSLDAARGHLDEARLLVRDSLAEARRSIWELRSQSSESGDLAARLSQAANRAVGTRPVKVSVLVHGTNRELDRKMEDELLRIGQEAVANALRHAQPQRIEIELNFDPKKFCMTVTDDGCGFAADPLLLPNGHYGLRGMRERAEQIDGTLIVESAVGKGTKVSVEAPLG